MGGKSNEKNLDINMYEKYFHYMLHSLANEIQNFANVHTQYKKKYKFYKNKYTYRIYESYRTQSIFYLGRIYNIIGDETKNTISYKRLRKILVSHFNDAKFHLNQKDSELISSYRTQRNWVSHFTTNDFHAHYLYEKSSKELIFVIETKYVDNELFVDLKNRNEVEYYKMCRVLELAINDYYNFFNNKLFIAKNENEIVGLEGLDNADKSYTNYINKKYPNR